MKKIYLILLLCCLKAFAQAPAMNVIWETPQSRINVYIVSQGFTNASMGAFDTFASGLVARFWSTPPYSTYQNLFRVTTVKVIADTETYPRALNLFPPEVDYSCYSGAYDGSESAETFYGRMDTLISNHIPGYDEHSYIIAIFNSNYYTGGGGRYTFASTYCGPGNNTLMQNVAIHEFSHSFALLGDEYQSNTAQVNPAQFPIFNDRNVTTRNVREEIPWNYLTNPPAPLITCTGDCFSSSGIGLYQGANYNQFGWYRPAPNCKMRNVLQPFCQVCRDIITERILEHLCDPNVNISEDFISKHQYMTHWRKSINDMTTTSKIGDHIHVDFTAQESVVMTPGFDARPGSVFSARIHECGDIDVRNPYRVKQNNTVYACQMHPEGKMPHASTYSSSDIKMYPNPTNGLVEIDFQNGILSDITILSMEGKVVF